MKKLLIICALIFGFMAPTASINAQSLTEEEKEQLKDRILDKLDDFQDFLQTMADNRNSMPVRQNAKESNIKLFIGECEPYKVTHMETGREEIRKAVKMQTQSLRGKSPQKQPMKLYLNNLLNNTRYANIEITQSDAVRVGDIQPVGNGQYVAIAQICQKFVGFNENGTVRYGDITEKKVKIYIDHTAVRTANGIEHIWDVKIGDMYVVSVKKNR